jgi:Uncharacterized protein conserved in bacteria (DUF2255)
MRQKAGRITVAGSTKEVLFEPVNGPINDRIDDAYRAKYKGSPHLDPMIGARARSATVKSILARQKDIQVLAPGQSFRIKPGDSRALVFVVLGGERGYRRKVLERCYVSCHGVVRDNLAK